MHRLFPKAVRTTLCLAALVAGAPAAWAQAPAAPAPPPPIWAGSAGLGLAVTSGNADTSSFNVTFKGTYDPMNPHKATVDALYMRGSSEGDLVINRLTFGGRDDFSLTDRASVFAQVRYLRDTFKAIEYLVAPTVGLGYKIIATEATTLAVDAGGGGVWEKDTNFSTKASGALTLGQTFSHKLSGTATVTEAASGLWKTSDFGDVLYTFGAGLTAAITPKSTVKIELLETYKGQPPVPTIQKQDVALITSLVYAF
jgi:putative salt-induced outer membrane protein